MLNEKLDLFSVAGTHFNRLPIAARVILRDWTRSSQWCPIREPIEGRGSLSLLVMLPMLGFIAYMLAADFGAERGFRLGNGSVILLTAAAFATVWLGVDAIRYWRWKRRQAIYPGVYLLGLTIVDARTDRTKFHAVRDLKPYVVHHNVNGRHAFSLLHIQGFEFKFRFKAAVDNVLRGVFERLNQANEAFGNNDVAALAQIDPLAQFDGAMLATEVASSPAAPTISPLRRTLAHWVAAVAAIPAMMGIVAARNARSDQAAFENVNMASAAEVQTYRTEGGVHEVSQ